MTSLSVDEEHNQIRCMQQLTEAMENVDYYWPWAQVL
jgi:hypothetical protein